MHGATPFAATFSGLLRKRGRTLEINKGIEGNFSSTSQLSALEASLCASICVILWYFGSFDVDLLPSGDLFELYPRSAEGLLECGLKASVIAGRHL